MPAPEKVAQRLELEPGAPTFYLRRLRNLNERPYLIDEHYVPHNLCPGIENKNLDNVSLYKTLQDDHDFDLHHGWREFRPVMPSSDEEIDLLGIYANTPLILVESTVYNRSNVPLDYFTIRIHGKFSAEVVNAEDLL